MAKKQKFNALLTIFLCVVFLVAGFCAGGYGFILYKSHHEIANIPVYTSGDISFHFLELGNKYSGDCTYIKAGDLDILIDAGSRSSSIPVITNYINDYVEDNKLEYVIVTHAHEDHYAGFATGENTQSLFDMYLVGTIIDFAQHNKEGKEQYTDYVRERSEATQKGAVHYTAKECMEEVNGAKSSYDLGNDITLTILDQKFYYEKDSGTHENNHSVCTLFTQGDKNFLFTGDLEKEGEESLVEMNSLPKCNLYKAGHHGSKTSSNDVLLDVIQPDICVVCCCAGNYEYTKTSGDATQANLNNFPTQDFVNRISKHTREVYVTTLGLPKYDSTNTGAVKYDNDSFTSMNGNVVVKNTNGLITVECSNNNTLLKDTDWFKENRTCPSSWLAS